MFRISVVGTAMRSQPGVAKTMFETFAARVNIQVISTSEIKISVLIDAEYTELAVRSLHTAFGLDEGSDMTARMDYPYAKICRHTDDLIWRHAVKSLNDLTKWPNKLHLQGYSAALLQIIWVGIGEVAFDTKILPGVGEGQTMNDSFKRVEAVASGS